MDPRERVMIGEGESLKCTEAELQGVGELDSFTQIGAKFREPRSLYVEG
jgi:hypothetical protein